MYESAVNDNAEDFPQVAVDADPTVVVGVKFASTFVDWGDQSLVPNFGEDAEDDVKTFKYSQLEFVVCVYFLIALCLSRYYSTTPLTVQQPALFVYINLVTHCGRD